MSNIINNTNVSAFTYFAQIQQLFSQYVQKMSQLSFLEKNLESSSSVFYSYPTQQNLFIVENTFNQKLQIMRQVPQLINSIVNNLIEATILLLSSLQKNISENNKIGIVIDDNALSSICSIIDQNSQQPLSIRDIYIRQCLSRNIPMLISNIEVRAQMNRITLPNFTKLEKILNNV